MGKKPDPDLRQSVRQDESLHRLLRFQQRIYEMRQRLIGDPYEAGIKRLALLGWFDRKPCDLSACASSLGLSRQTVARLVARLVREGALSTERQRNRVVIHPTPALMQSFLEIAPGMMRRYRQALAEILEGYEKNRGG